MGTYRKWVALHGNKDRYSRIISVGAENVEAGVEEIKRQLNRPGRYGAFRVWQESGFMVLDENGIISTEKERIGDGEPMRYRYYLVNRPPSIGCQPKGDVAREVWSPRRKMSAQGRLVHGWVEYDQPLSAYNIWSYELFPASIQEQAQMVFVEGGEYNSSRHEYWCSQNLKDLKRLYKEMDDQKAWAALVLLGEIDQPF